MVGLFLCDLFYANFGCCFSEYKRVDSFIYDLGCRKPQVMCYGITKLTVEIDQ